MLGNTCQQEKNSEIVNYDVQHNFNDVDGQAEDAARASRVCTGGLVSGCWDQE